MICPNCQHQNPTGANFCSNCGHKLERTCPNCGTPADPSANFCSNCGHNLASPARPEAKPSAFTPPHLASKILRERETIRGERRTVTVLFVDAAGSTALGELLDPEDLYTLTQSAVQRMMDVVYDYEGTVAQFRGDGILALFGAPIAHEDAARRAVGAALAMQQSLGEYGREVVETYGVDLRFRIGLNTGRVVVGHIGDDLDMEFTALGDMVNVGARIEGLAEPGSVYVAENTYRAAQAYFDFEPVGQLSVKGKSESVPVYKALRERALRTRFEVSAERGFTPYVGRQHELDTLKRRLEQAKSGRGQVIFVSGEAGIGKSRLLLEFRRSLGDEVSWLEGQCLSFGKNIAYRPIIDLLQDIFSVEESDSEARVIERVDQATAGWDEKAQGTAPYLKALLSVDPGDPAILEMDPRQRRAGILDGLRAVLLRFCQEKPLVVVVEDLHWIDEGSEEALRALVDVVASANVLLILTYRPGYKHRLGERSYFDRLVLGELPPEHSAALAQGVLHQAELPQEITSLITGKGEGNPFYIEEVTKALVESGALRRQNGSYTLARPAEGIVIPDTIQEVILSRIDRLAAEARGALQLASVIGREFTARLLDRIADLEASLDEVLGELKSLELIYQEAYFPELSYMFKHALTQDVAYRTLLRDRRKNLHRVIGAAIEELYAERLAEQVEMLAHHYYEGEAWEKALHYLERAGDKAAAAYLNEDALDYYARALKVCERAGPENSEAVADLSWKRANLYWTIGDYKAAVSEFTEVRDAARKLGDRRKEGLVLSISGAMLYLNHHPERAESSLKEALALAEEEKAEGIRYFASSMLGMSYTAYGRYTEAKPYMKVADELASQVNDPLIKNWTLLQSPLWSRWAGRFDDALARFGEFQLTDERLNVIDLLAMWVKCLALGDAGRYQEALTLLHRIIEASERVGEMPAYVRSLNTLGWIYGEIQDHESAMAWNRRCIEVTGRNVFDNPEMENNARLNLGDNLLALGRVEEAEEQFQKVEKIVRDPRPSQRLAIWRYSQHLFHSYGGLCLGRGETERALAYAGECLVIAEESESQKNIVKARRLRAQARMAQGRLDDAGDELTTALEVALQFGNPSQLWQTYEALGDLRVLQERPDAARAAYRQAQAIIENVAAGLADRDQRKTLLESAAARALSRKLPVS